jgi:hypothetical protein
MDFCWRDNNTFATQLAAIIIHELEHTINEMRNMPPKCVNLPQTLDDDLSPLKELIKFIKTSCAPIGYTNEAGAEARTKMFALWITLGHHHV